MNHSSSRKAFECAAEPSKRPSPFSLRLSFEERAELERLADGAPLGAYIKSKIFVNGTGARSRVKQVDRAALAKILSSIGQSRVPQNLNQIAKAANIGALPVSPELEDELRLACAEIKALRSTLMAALGKREGAS